MRPTRSPRPARRRCSIRPRPARRSRPRAARARRRTAASSSIRCSDGAPLHHFAHRDGVLFAEDVPVAAIAAAVKTPFYCYSTATLTRHYKVFEAAFAGLDHLICYALKANSNQAVIATLARLGAGADVVSEGELRRAL